MSYIVFARKWRPKDFDEVIGQEHITTTLKNAISNNRVAHAYMFTGPRGIGKTSVARIFAKGLNCEKGPTTSPCSKCASCASIASGTSMDVIEIDGASNNSVDQVRELRENIKFMPSYGKYKVYIIDEVHMLSIGAFNALLKTLEEPPEHAKFIFATTHPEKVPPTILSRCQRFDFRRISLKLIISKLENIAKAERLNISEDAIFSIAKSSDGSLRDAESVLDQLASFCEKKISGEDVMALLGIIEEDRLSDVMEKLSKKDTAGLLKALDELIITGKDISQFLTGLMAYLRNLMVLKVSSELSSLIDLPDNYITRLKEQTKNFQIDELLYMFYTISATVNAIKRSEVSRFIVEAALIKLSLRSEMMSLPEIMEKVAHLEANAGKHISSSDGRRLSGESSNSSAEAKRDKYSAKEDFSAEAKHGKYSPATADQPLAQEAHPPMAEALAKEEAINKETMDTTSEKKEFKEESHDEAKSTVTLTKESVRETWPKILEIIKNKRMSIASYLLEGEITEVNGSVITLGFAKKFNFHKETLEYTNNRRFVEEIASAVFKQSIQLKFLTLEDSGMSSSEADGSSKFNREMDLEYEAKKDAPAEPIIQSAIEMFDGKIINGKEGLNRRPVFRNSNNNKENIDKGEHSGE
jgi:DNA polymerase-3 subunit gamma/tau